MNDKKRNISASALSNDALEDVSGGYQILNVPSSKDNTLEKVIINLSGDEQKWLKDHGYKLNDSTNFYQSIQDSNGKSIGSRGIESILSANGFSNHSG